MAKDKKAVLIYSDWKHTFDLLSNEQAGKLVKHLFKYVNDENPVCDDKLVEIAFEPMKQQLKRDLRKYEGIVQKRSEAGKASAEKRKQEQTTSTSVDTTKQRQTKLPVEDFSLIPKHPPRTKENIEEFFTLEGKPEEAEKFFNYYESNGWKVGRATMKNWKAAAKNWISRTNNFKTNGQTNSKQSRLDGFIGG